MIIIHTAVTDHYHWPMVGAHAHYHEGSLITAECTVDCPVQNIKATVVVIGRDDFGWPRRFRATGCTATIATPLLLPMLGKKIFSVLTRKENVSVFVFVVFSRTDRFEFVWFFFFFFFLFTSECDSVLLFNPFFLFPAPFYLPSDCRIPSTSSAV